MRHLTVDVILEHVEGKSDAASQAEIQAHLSECAQCREQAAEFGELVGFLSMDAENEPPRETLRSAVELFQPILRPAEGRFEKVIRIARRVFDSYEQPVEGVRTVDVAPRQLLYREGEFDVDLRIESGDGRMSLEGQVLSRKGSFPDNTQVRLESGGEVRFRTSTNAVGEFSFESIPDDTYHLAFELPEGDLRLFCVSQAARA